jgi:hypothetical protein
MTTNGNETPAAPVANLRAARKELTQARAASKAAHPAGKQTPAKAPAKKAPAKAPAKKQAAKTGTPKLRWQFPSGFAERATTGQTASFDGGELAMKPVDGKWKATFTKGGTETVLAEGVGAAKAYAACVEHAKGNGAAA